MLYNVQNPVQQAMGGMNQAAGTYGRMMPNIPANQKPGPSVGGAVMSGMGGAGTGAAMGSFLGATAATETAPAVAALGMGPAGWAVAGGLLGIGSYLFS
jgi:hypothetical protein